MRVKGYFEDFYKNVQFNLTPSSTVSSLTVPKSESTQPYCPVVMNAPQYSHFADDAIASGAPQFGQLRLDASAAASRVCVPAERMNFIL